MARTHSDTENNTGKKPEALEPLPELSDFLFVYNTTNQAHNHTRTVKALAEFAGRTEGKNMKILIKRGQEATFTKPVLQTSGAGTSSDPGGPTREDIETYKIEKTQYLRDIREYQKQKEKMFAIIFNQCTPEVKNRLENSADFNNMEDEDDVKALISKLEDMAYSVTGHENAYWTTQRSLRRLAGVQQGNNGDSLIKYMERFMSYLKTSLHNTFVEGNDNYPTTVSKAVELMTNYNSENNSAPAGPGEGTSFGQTHNMPKKPCPKCRKRHPYGPCADDSSRNSSRSSRSSSSATSRRRRELAHAQIREEYSSDEDSSEASH
jgi:hypothetical protein